MSGEVVKDCKTYTEAAGNACDVLGSFKMGKVDTYKGRLGDGTDKVVGIEIYNDNSKKIARIRLDLDVPKGIHFNTEDWQGTTKKTASCITSTKNKPTAENAVVYADYLKALDGLSGRTIWDWWKNGEKPIPKTLGE